MSLLRYPEYKDSGARWLGEVPAHWDLMRLRRCVRLNPSKSEVAAMPRDLEVSFLPMEAVGDDGSLSLERERPIQEVETGYTYFRNGDVAFAKITPCFENGKGALMSGLTHGVGFGTTELTVARPIPGLMSSAFLHWVFRSPNFRSEGEASMYGAGGQKRVPDDFVRELLWAIPPDSERERIATFLDRETAKIDALIAEQEKLLALLAEKRQATISHAVTRGLNPNAPMKDSGIPWLGEVPAHWERAQLGRLCTQVSDGPHFSPTYVDEGVMFISARNIRVDGWSLEDAKYVSESDYEEFCKRVIPEVGDILYTKGGTTGIARVVDLKDRFQVWVHLAVLKVKKDVALPHYVAYALNSRGCYEQSQLYTRGATNQDLGLTRMVKIFLALPPVEEQAAVIDFLDAETSKLDALNRQSEQAISLLRERRSALISAAVTGKIDVRAC